MTEEFRDEIRASIRRHGQDLDADDLRDLAGDLEKTAENWDGVEV